MVPREEFNSLRKKSIVIIMSVITAGRGDVVVRTDPEYGDADNVCQCVPENTPRGHWTRQMFKLALFLYECASIAVFSVGVREVFAIDDNFDLKTWFGIALVDCGILAMWALTKACRYRWWTMKTKPEHHPPEMYLPAMWVIAKLSTSVIAAVVLGLQLKEDADTFPCGVRSNTIRRCVDILTLGHLIVVTYVLRVAFVMTIDACFNVDGRRMRMRKSKTVDSAPTETVFKLSKSASATGKKPTIANDSTDESAGDDDDEE